MLDCKGIILVEKYKVSQIKKIENKEEIDGEFTIDELSDLKL